MRFGPAADGGWEICGTERELRDLMTVLGTGIDDGEAEAMVLGEDGVTMLYVVTTSESNGHT